MVSLNEMEAMLEEILARFPQDLFKDLNGGIILLPEKKLNAHSRNNDLYVMAEYSCGGNMGRYITVYYASFMRVYGHFTDEELKKQLESTLKHEFIHHLESLGGERSLEIKDEIFLSDYLDRYDPG